MSMDLTLLQNLSLIGQSVLNTARKDEQITNLQDKLSPKRWSSLLYDNITERTISMPADMIGFDDVSSYSSGDNPQDTAIGGAEKPSADLEVPEMPTKSAFGKEELTCALCSEPFADGEQVVESNNPQCTHCHHKACMDKWLQFQNTCPVCNQAYVLHTV
jgi:Ring finger domain